MAKKPPNSSSLGNVELASSLSPQKKIKVVHLITLLELGGAQGNTIYTVRHLDPDLYETHLWTGKGAFWDQSVEMDLAKEGRLRYFKTLVRQINPFLDLWAVFDLWLALKKFKPDILHTHSSKAGILGRLAGKLAGVPTVIHTFHGFGFNSQQKFVTRNLFIFLERWTSKMAQKLIFVSQANQNEAKQRKIGTDQQYELIRSGVPLKSIRDDARHSVPSVVRKKINIPSSAKLLITIGAFKPQKNLLELVTLVHTLVKTVPDLHCLVIGDGEERALLENKIKEFKLEPNFHLLGWRQDIPELLAASDIFVMTSLWEGLPRALLEAQSLGIPAICYETDGVKDILSKGGGILVPQKDVPSFVKAVTKILEDKNYYRQLSDQAKKNIDDEFDIDWMVKKQEFLYQASFRQKPESSNLPSDETAGIGRKET